jgi:hypothetical protein
MTNNDKGDTMHETEPTDPILSCLGCGITRDDIARLRLDIPFIGHGAPILDGTDEVLLICGRCIDNPDALARALAREIGGSSPGRWKVIAALLALRDKAVLGASEARTAESAAMFARAGEAAVPWFKLAGERLDRIEDILGIDGDANRPAEEQRAKNGLMGALAGALIGAIVGSASKPLEALKAVIDKGHELVEDALRQRHAGTVE